MASDRSRNGCTAPSPQPLQHAVTALLQVSDCALYYIMGCCKLDCALHRDMPHRAGAVPGGGGRGTRRRDDADFGQCAKDCALCAATLRRNAVPSLRGVRRATRRVGHVDGRSGSSRRRARRLGTSRSTRRPSRRRCGVQHGIGLAWHWPLHGMALACGGMALACGGMA